MYELVQVSEKCYYINCPAKIGVYAADKDNVYLIDSGNDKDAGRKVRQILDKNGWHLTAILNTHSNADHIGGNRYLQGQTGCKVYSSGIEAAFTKYPALEPSFLYGGYPCKDLRHKFLMAQGSSVTDFLDESFPKEIEVIPLRGISLTWWDSVCQMGWYSLQTVSAAGKRWRSTQYLSFMMWGPIWKHWTWWRKWKPSCLFLPMRKCLPI